MRLFLEVISAEVNTLEMVNRKSGAIEKRDRLTVFGLDRDYPESAIKAVFWRDFEKLLPEMQRSAVVELIFREMKAPNQYDKVPSVNVNAENCRVVLTAEKALREQIERMKANGKPKAEPKPEGAAA